MRAVSLEEKGELTILLGIPHDATPDKEKPNDSHSVFGVTFALLDYIYKRIKNINYL